MTDHLQTIHSAATDTGCFPARPWSGCCPAQAIHNNDGALPCHAMQCYVGYEKSPFSNLTRLPSPIQRYGNIQTTA